MLKLSDLAQRPDFDLGPLQISPARRQVAGPAGEAHVEPLIMQVFLLLLDVGGQVVTRQALFDQVWGGVAVGDDSLNRAVAGVRRIAAETAPGLFEIETIPRTGYRVTGEILSFQNEGQDDQSQHGGDVSRRLLIGGGAATLALGGAGYWWLGHERTDPRVTKLIADGKRILIDSWPGTEGQAVEVFRKAVAIDPHNAEAWGLLAYAHAGALQFMSPETAGGAVQAEIAAQRALAIDPKEPNALLAMLALQRGMLDMASPEDEFRRILAIDPDNVLALRSLAQLLQTVGRCRDAYVTGGRANAIAPMSPDLKFRRALTLWINGRLAEADRISDRSMELWPSHPLVRLGRLMIYAFTGRPRAALAIVEDEEASPLLLSPAAASVWRASLVALEEHTPSAIAAAREANLEGAKTTPAIASAGILILSALGELDAAFEVANGFLLGRGSIIVRPKPSNVPSVNSAGWRNKMGLFTPPAKAMRLDPRFRPLCDELGLTEYWRKRGIGPDAFLFKV